MATKPLVIADMTRLLRSMIVEAAAKLPQSAKDSIETKLALQLDPLALLLLYGHMCNG